MRLEWPAEAWGVDDHVASGDRQRMQSHRLERLGEVAGGVAHDVNNLLAGIMGYATLVSTRLAAEMERHGLRDDAAFVALLEDIGQISAVSERAASLTHQVLAFGRETESRPEAVELSAAIAGMEGLLRRSLGAHADDLSTNLGAHLAAVEIDRGQLEQVVMNLVVNARDAMPDGGGLLIETSQLLEDGATPAAVRLAVVDHGIGMTSEVVDRACEPFFTTKVRAAASGTGLGLATVRRIVEAAGGRLTIRSTPGLGTTVRVDLPATTDAPMPLRAVRSAPPATTAGGETVLLVDDETLVREPVRRVLEVHGYTVLAAASADEALVLLAAHPGAIDLLMTDVVMPGRYGPQLSNEVARTRPHIKVLFTSGYDRAALEEHGLLGAGDHLLAKPASTPELLHQVRAALDQ
jgi:hypothetical protein